MNGKLLVITGPTATGKTALGIALAKELDGEIVSADSMQIYRGMDIGTAKPTKDERLAARHHMIDAADPGEDYSVSRYAREAAECVDDILRRGKRPIVVGGTGLYIEALLRGSGFAPKGDPALREELEAAFLQEGETAFRERLRAVDPESEARINRNDRKRLIRAMEVWLLSGRTLTEFDRESRLAPPRYESVRMALDFREREDLYRRIDRRVDDMAAQGLKDEVAALLKSGVTPKCTAMQAIGYKELVRALEGEIAEAEAIEEIKRESRRYAKRQLSWLRRDGELHWIVWDKEPDLTKGVAVSTKFAHEAGV